MEDSAQHTCIDDDWYVFMPMENILAFERVIDQLEEVRDELGKLKFEDAHVEKMKDDDPENKEQHYNNV